MPYVRTAVSAIMEIVVSIIKMRASQTGRVVSAGKRGQEIASLKNTLQNTQGRAAKGTFACHLR